MHLREDSHLDDGFDRPLVTSGELCLYERVAALANHKSEPEANAWYVLDEDRNVHRIAAIIDIYSGEEIFVIMGTSGRFNW